VQAPVTITGNPTRRAFEELYTKTYGRPSKDSSGSLPLVGRAGEADQRAGASPTPSATSPTIPLPRREGPGEGLLSTKSDPRRQRRLVILGVSGGGRSLNESVPAVAAGAARAAPAR